MKVALLIAYNGSAFSGWQRQVQGVSTVQGELEDALGIFLSSKGLVHGGDEAREPVRVSGSGRTDAGVHAVGQVATFEWPSVIPYKAAELKRALNGITCKDLSVRSVSEAPDDFDARFNPHRKRYSYTICHGQVLPALNREMCWWLPRRLNVTDMIEAARLFKGTKDFQGFRASDCSANTSVRTVLKSEFETRVDGNLLYLVEGKGFLKNMVRIMLGTLVEVGQGKRSVESISDILELQDRTLAGITAPANGLCLESVSYPDFKFS